MRRTSGGIGRSSVRRMTDPVFDADTIAALRDLREVRIETLGPNGQPHRVIIWVVVDDSWPGGDSLVARSRGALVSGGGCRRACGIHSG